MKNKKMIAMLSATLVSAGLIGASLAYFSSSDDILNRFKMGSTTEPPGNLTAGLIAVENFGDSVYTDGQDVTGLADITEYGETTKTSFKTGYTANDEQRLVYIKDNPDTATVENENDLVINMPGSKYNKQMSVHSTVDYDQVVRAKVVVDAGELVPDLINVDYAPNNKWVKIGEWYYYKGDGKGALLPHTQADDLVSSITLDKELPNEWKNAEFTVQLLAEGIQFENYDAVKPTTWPALSEITK